MVLDIQNTILGYFHEKWAIPIDDRNTALKLNFIAEEIADSFGVIELIIWLEERYKVKFSTEQLQSERFRTIEGLSHIVAELAG